MVVNTRRIAINVTVSPLIGAIVLSFYANAAYPQAWSHITDCGKCAFIRGHDVRHRAILHKRENSWDPHFHVSVQPEYCDAFVPQALEITALSPHDETHLKLAARYLCKNPFEPGLAFSGRQLCREWGRQVNVRSPGKFTPYQWPIKAFLMTGLVSTQCDSMGSRWNITSASGRYSSTCRLALAPSS